MTKKNKLSDLRDHLFETLEMLKDPEKPMDIARAKAVANVAQVIINSATVEVKAMDAMNAEAPEFFNGKSSAPALPAAGHGPGPPNGRSVRPTA